jgi:hypothetical protein
MPKRDLNRFREILIEVVEAPSEHDDGLVVLGDKMQAGDEYQLYLMRDAGLIEGTGAKSGIFFVTSSGQDFYEATRSEGIWTETKAAVVATGGSATVEIVKAIAVGFIKKTIAKHTGVEF